MSLNREQPMRPFLEELADAFEGDMPLEYVRTFGTVADMQAATDLKAGMTCHTNGFHAAGDGGAAYYTIGTTGTANGMDVLALQGELYATLVVTEPYVTPEMFGAYGDGTHDDAPKIRAALEYLKATYTASTSWNRCGLLRLMPKTYLVDSAIIDANFSAGATLIAIEGSGTRSTIKAGANCAIMFDNQNKICFSNFSDVVFSGNDNTFLYTTGANPQRLRFNRCSFSNFHMIADVQGDVDNSEFVFNQCAISSCGSSENNCELFRFNNSQAVNWRFYATDIETFTGVCFHIMKGINISFFQGSIIPTGGLVFSYDGADPTYFGGGNLPAAAMYAVRYELRNSRLLYASFNGIVQIIHSECSMGGYSISDDSDTITLINCTTNLEFRNCTNFNNYKINAQFNRSSVQLNNYIKFSGISRAVVIGIINRSTFAASQLSPTYANNVPKVFVDGCRIDGLGRFTYTNQGQAVNRVLTFIDNSMDGSSTNGVKTNLPHKGFLSAVTLESVYTTSFGNTNLVAEIYNASGTLVATTSVSTQSRTKSVAQINETVTTDWYVLLKNNYGSSSTLYIPHVLYAEYLS